MDSTRVTEHPTSHERRQSGAGRPASPADPRGALLRTSDQPSPPPGTGALPVQARSGDVPRHPGPAAPCGRHGASGGQTPAGTGSGTDAPPPAAGDAAAEHSQPASAEPDRTGRGPRRRASRYSRTPSGAVPRAVPAVPNAARDGASRRAVRCRCGGTGTGCGSSGAATRRIARGIDLDEIVLGLCRATVPTFADAILVYLRDPLPVGDERPTGPLVLRLRRTDRIPGGAGTPTAGSCRWCVPEPG